MAMTKVFSVKVPDSAANLQARMGLAAKKSGIQVWELLVRMMDRWEQQPDEAPAETKDWQEWRDSVESELQKLRAELAAVRAQENQENIGLPVTQSIESVVAEAESGSQDTASAAETDEETFESTYDALERDRHAMIWKLREALGWPRKKFDGILRQLRDEGRYQPMRGGETEHMTKKQLRDGFVDENGFRHLTIMRVPSAAAAPVVEADMSAGTHPAEQVEVVKDPPLQRKRGRPSKAELERRALEQQQTADAEETAKIPEDLPAPRKRGRPSKVQKF